MKPPPQARGGDGRHKRSGSLLLRNLDQTRRPPQAPSTFARDDLAIAQVREIWWRELRLGNRPPAEPGVILLDGGRQ